ncbi:hypothetical protein Hanom_Chr04g00323761 [Helianthus anomalus]
MARYSASAEERETTDCFLVLQEIRVPPSKRKYPVRDLLVYGHPNQSESQYADKTRSPSRERRMPRPGVAFK